MIDNAKLAVWQEDARKTLSYGGDPEAMQYAKRILFLVSEIKTLQEELEAVGPGEIVKTTTYVEHYGHRIVVGHESMSQIPICRVCNRDLKDNTITMLISAGEMGDPNLRGGG